MTPTARANVPAKARPIASWPRAAAYALPSLPSPAWTSTTCCAAVGSRTLAMSPPDGAEAVRQIVRMAAEEALEPPRPLARELPPADPFPVEALGPILRPAAEAIHDKVQ